MMFRADQKDAHHMPRPYGCSAREEWQADAMQQAAVAPVLTKVQLLFSHLALLTSTLHVEKKLHPKVQVRLILVAWHRRDQWMKLPQNF
jgi:hypothetical protein